MAGQELVLRLEHRRPVAHVDGRHFIYNRARAPICQQRAHGFVDAAFFRHLP